MSVQSENVDIVNDVTAIVREADEVFQRVGGSSRHWTRDCFLPLLNERGIVVMREAERLLLVESLTALVADIESGLLVRDITRDADPRWSIEMIAFVQRLQRAQAAILAAASTDGGTRP